MASISEGVDDDDQSVTSAALGIESSATSFSEAVVDAGGARTTPSRFWGVYWHRGDKKWQAHYRDADGKLRHIGYFDDEEEAARAVNKAIRDAGLEGKRHAGLEGQRKTNPVVDGQLVPRARLACGHGEKSLRKRRREESAAAAPSTDTELALRAELKRLKAENRELKRRRR